MHIHLVTCVDPSLGKVEKSILPQQTLMELFVKKVTLNKAFIWGNADGQPPITDWHGTAGFGSGVEFKDSGEVTVINFYRLSLNGSIHLEWLPLTTTICDLSSNELSGTVSLDRLPDPLVELDLSSNFFVGKVNLTSLSAGMKILKLHHNEFCGETDFSHLPESLVELGVSFTQMEGTIHMRDGLAVFANYTGIKIA